MAARRGAEPAGARPEIRALGPLQLTGADGRELPLEGRIQRRLLAALLLVAPRGLSSDRLIEILWDDEPPADARAALQVHVSRLRRALRASGAPDEALATEPAGYRLDRDRFELDLERFEEALGRARAAPSPTAALAALDEAFALWRGAPFEETAGRPVPSGEVARLTELRVGARELAAEQRMASGDLSGAVAGLEALAAEEPLRERSHALLAEALYALGRGAEALSVVQRFRVRLSDELGIDPSPALRELELRLVRHEMPPIAGAAALPRTEITAPARGPRVAVEYLTLPDGRSLAFATAGSGPPILVPPAFVTHLDALAEAYDPRSRFFGALAERFRLLLWDRFGSGLSQGEPETIDLTDTTECLAVLDRLEIPRAAVLAVSSAGPTALALAARHPQRVSALVLLGTYASGAATFGPPDVLDSIASLARVHWGLGSKMLTDLMFPGCSPELAERVARLQQRAATPEIAARVLEAMARVELRDELGAVEAPALVVHYKRDRAIPFRGGRDLAASLGAARLVPLPGVAHLPTDADVDRIVELVEAFLAGAPPAMPARKSPASGP